MFCDLLINNFVDSDLMHLLDTPTISEELEIGAAQSNEGHLSWNFIYLNFFWHPELPLFNIFYLLS